MRRKIPIPNFDAPKSRINTSRRNKRPLPQADPSKKTAARTSTSTSASNCRINEDATSNQAPRSKKQQLSAVSSESTSSSSLTSKHSYLSSLHKIETAIQLLARRSSSKNSPSSDISFSLLLEKFINVICRAIGGNGSATKSMAESLAIVYLVTASPELVQYEYDQEKLTFQTKNNTDENDENNAVKSSEKKRVNRIEKITKLYKSNWKGWENDKVKKLKEHIMNRKSRQEKKSTTSKTVNTITGNGMSQNGSSTKFTEEAIIKPGMTLEQRVRARSKQSEQILAAQSQKDKEASSKRNKSGNQNVLHLHFADAVNLHMRHASNRRHSRALSSEEKKAMPMRPMPLNDLCAELSGGTVQTSGLNSRKLYSKNEVRKILYELVDMVPEWIKIVSTSGSGSGQNGRVLGKDRVRKKVLMVVVKSGISYQAVREKLGGRTVRVDKSKPVNGIDSKKDMLKQISQKPRQSIADAALGLQSKSSASKKRRPISDLVKRAKKHQQQQEQPQLKSQPQPQSQPQSQPQRSKLSLPKRSIFPPSSMPKKGVNSNANIENGKNNVKKTDDNGLRVNYCQLMTDEDYHGGLVLQSNSTNPRGLKRMFSQLNAGERI